MYFMLKSPPSRPTFPADMTDPEREIMQRHIAYWTGLMNQGYVIAFGPVLDPKGGYGLGIVEVEDETDVQRFIKQDPAVQAGLMNTEYYPMRAVVPGKSNP